MRENENKLNNDDAYMKRYPSAIETKIVKFYSSLNERDRRRYAAVEVSRLEHGGLEYMSQLLSCDPKTIRRGINELEAEDKLLIDRQ